MKMSRRAQRMERHHRKHRYAVSLNLVSLMDIFTILVFFLLVNASEVEILPSARSISLPQSVSREQPHRTIAIMVTPEEISILGRRIVAVDRVLQSENDNIPLLQRTLEQFTGDLPSGSRDDGPEVTIMADRHISYKLLKKIMLSCSQAGFGKVSFAVLQELSDTPS